MWIKLNQIKVTWMLNQVIYTMVSFSLPNLLYIHIFGDSD